MKTAPIDINARARRAPGAVRPARGVGLFGLMCLTGLAVMSSGAWAQDVQAGANKVAACAGCHAIPGYRASFPEVHRVPKIAGQTAAYIEASLRAYRSGDRLHPTMRSVAAALSDQDMADIAAYYEQLGQQ